VHSSGDRTGALSIRAHVEGWATVESRIHEENRLVHPRMLSDRTQAGEAMTKVLVTGDPDQAIVLTGARDAKIEKIE
jgi:hypothetical protein